MLLLNALGAAHFQWKKYDQAQGFYREALDLGETLGKRDEMARVLIHLGGASQVAGRLDEARERYGRALAICREIGMRAEEATALNNLGTLALQQGDTGGAIGYLREAVGIKEKLRLTAAGTTRRDFLASWISSYRWLIQAYHLAGDAAATFDAAETVKARTLAEQMRARLPGSGDASPLDIRAVQRALSGKAVLVSFANVDWEHPIVVCASRLGIRSAPLGTIAPVAPDAPPQAEISPRTPPPQARGYLVIQSDEEVRGRFESLVQAYRWLLALPRLSEEQMKLRTSLGRTLYDMLLAPIRKSWPAPRSFSSSPTEARASFPSRRSSCRMAGGWWRASTSRICPPSGEVPDRQAGPLPCRAASPRAGRRPIRGPASACACSDFPRTVGRPPRGGEPSSGRRQAGPGSLRGSWPGLLARSARYPGRGDSDRRRRGWERCSQRRRCLGEDGEATRPTGSAAHLPCAALRHPWGARPRCAGAFRRRAVRSGRGPPTRMAT